MIATIPIALLVAADFIVGLQIRQPFIKGGMRSRQANEDEVAIMVDTGLTHRLTTVEVIAQNGAAALGNEAVMSLEPSFAAAVSLSCLAAPS